MNASQEPMKNTSFTEDVRVLEERLFRGSFDASDPRRMKHAGYAWHYRPSHHVKTGLVTANDISLLSQPDKRLLSVGAYPMYLEQLLCVLGVLAENMLVADIDPKIRHSEGVMPKAMFDATGIWPEIGSFDLIIFPESLCMAVGGDSKPDTEKEKDDFSADQKEGQLLGSVLIQALKKLRPSGEIRANGPMSHPNVVNIARTKIDAAGMQYEIDYERFFMKVRHKA
jgi:hypothetical protein